MRKVDKIIISQFLRYFVIAFVVAFFVIILGLLYDKISLILSKNLETKMYLQILFNIIIFLTPEVSIVASILGSIMFIVKLEDHLELTAMKSLGIGIKRILLSLSFFFIVFGSIVALFVYHFSPICKRKCTDLLKNLEEIDPSVSVKEGSFNNDIPGIGVFVERKSGTNLLNTVVYSHVRGNDAIDSLFIADNAEIIHEKGSKSTIILKNGSNFCEGEYLNRIDFDNEKNKNITIRNTFGEQKFFINMNEIIGNISNDDSLSNQEFSKILKLIKQKKLEIDKNRENIVEFIGKEYRNILDDISEKSEILLKREILKSLKNGSFNKNVFVESESVKVKCKNLFDEIKYCEKMLKVYYSELIKRFSKVIACFFMMILGIYYGFYLKRGSLILPLFIAAGLISIYFVGVAYGFNMKGNNMCMLIFKNIFGSFVLFLFILFRMLRNRLLKF